MKGFTATALLISMFGFMAWQPTRASSQSFMHLTQPTSGRAMRVSSGDPNWDHGNGDYRELGPGGSLVIGQLEGPGVINHLWFTFGTTATSSFWDSAPRDLVLKFYWDDQTSPSVQAPLGDFFAVGNGQTAYVDSMMVQIGGNVWPHAYNCYWPMPFAHHAKLVIENHHPTNTMNKCYFQVDWIKHAALPPNTLYFHAQYNVARPLPAGNDYTVADIVGGGQYVGTVFSLVNTPGAGFSEGDDRFFIDGESTPSIIGTGMEDYFGESWGFHTHNSLYQGFRYLSNGLTAYRWHIQDPIPFQHSLKVTFENMGSTNGGLPFEEKTWTEWSSVAFWYQMDQLPDYSSAEPGSWNIL